MTTTPHADPRERQLKIIQAVFEQQRREIRALAEVDQELGDPEISGLIDEACAAVNQVAETAGRKLYTDFAETEPLKVNAS